MRKRVVKEVPKTFFYKLDRVIALDEIDSGVRNEDTIIVWQDLEIAMDLALSFQESMSCSFVLEQICSVQRSI
ncbi:hypothetical protein SUGI_0727800 [Cryptomeria japonica]|nr:hypothetical protein SUGI_0727800 [Cryptomeria japonica]